MTQMCLSSISNEPEKLRQSLPHVFLRLQTGTIYPTRRCSSLTYSALKRSFWNAVCEKGYNNPSALQSCRCPLPRWQAGADDGQTPSPHSADHTEAHLLPFIRLAASVHLAQTQKTGIINTSRVVRITHWQGLAAPRVSPLAFVGNLAQKKPIAYTPHAAPDCRSRCRVREDVSRTAKPSPQSLCCPMTRSSSPFAQFLGKKIIALRHFACQPRQSWSFSIPLLHGDISFHVVLYSFVLFQKFFIKRQQDGFCRPAAFSGYQSAK